MTDEVIQWTYEKHLGEPRIARLTARSFEDIAKQIADELPANKIAFAIDKGWSDPVTDCLRPAFTFPVSPEIGDAFFNGVCGYRASYYSSTAAGEKANGAFIERLFDKIVSAADRHECKHTDGNGTPLEMTRSAVAVSLRLPSAKVWPFEDKDTNPEFHGIVNSDCLPLKIDIRADRWRRFAEMGIPKARKGVRALEIAHLEIKGAFITDAGEERISQNKVLRSCEIHKLGFT